MDIEVFLSAPAKAACSDWGPLCWFEAHPGLASWVQLLAVAVTLIVSVGSVLFQVWWTTSRPENQYQHRLVLRALHAAIVSVALVQTVRQTFDTMPDAVNSPPVLEGIGMAQATVAALPTVDFDNEDAVTRIILLGFKLNGLLRLVGDAPTLAGDQEGRALMHDQLDQYLREFQITYNGLAAVLSGLKAKLPDSYPALFEIQNPGE